MAEITMDVSEYEAMKKNERLLEESLENERTLRTELEKLKEEKIKALEDATMKVVKETLITKKSIKRDFKGFRELNEDLYSYYYNMIRGGVIPDRELYRLKRIINSHLIDVQLDENSETSYTTHGLDEIKNEIETRYKNEMDLEIKHKLEKTIENNMRLEESEELLRELNDELSLTKDDYSILIKEHEKLREDYKVLSEINDKRGGRLEKIHNVIKGGWNFFNKESTLRDVKTYLNEEIK